MSAPEPQNFRWQIDDVLAGCARPGWRDTDVSEDVVAAWVAGVQDKGIGSVVCLLDAQQLGYYSQVPGGLLGYYCVQGIAVEGVPTRDHQSPAPLSDDELKAIMKAFRRLARPVLIHCSAGCDRTGAALKYIGTKLE